MDWSRPGWMFLPPIDGEYPIGEVGRRDGNPALLRKVVSVSDEDDARLIATAPLLLHLVEETLEGMAADDPRRPAFENAVAHALNDLPTASRNRKPQTAT